MLRLIDDIADSLKEKTNDFKPEIVLILGSGLGGYADRIEQVAEVPYASLENFPSATVAGHSGKFVFGHMQGRRVAVMSGRIHYYEGRPMSSVVLPLRALFRMGATSLVVTNAAGGVNAAFDSGDVMLIRDHISLFCPNPLIGENIDALGTRFPDMSAPYDKEYAALARAGAKKAGLDLKEGVYCFLTGPSYETAADVRAVRTLGADSVGMSTVPEVTAARHCGMRVLGFSYIANKAVGLTDEVLTHTDVLAAFKKSEQKFYNMLDGVISKL